MTDGTSDIESVFRQAQLIDDPGERSAFISRSCQGNAAVERVVLELIQVWDGLRGPASPIASRSPQEPPLTSTIMTPARVTERAGEVIGRYRLLKTIGEGGFGTVFLAEQREPIRRNVALKIIKSGMDTRQVIARFEVERQTLALMDHPNIAKVLDAGATETGRPYFVMEYVAGLPITDYCDDHHLTIRERLDLFAQVCRAVQHAHTKGIIHRDLKPGNVLVSTQDDRPIAKVIDFGIAKATYAAMMDDTVVTEHRQLMGTPAYMSPEQSDGSADIDTRSDVYSLGVLLYELLIGSTPFSSEELRRAGVSEMHRLIREVDPPGLSARISLSTATLPTVAAKRKIEPQRLKSVVRGELDWVVMKCLEKNRMRRYDSAGSLVTEIGRYLNGEAVLAAPPSATYRLHKFVRKHRVSVAAGATVTAALIVGLGAALIGLRSAVQARDAETVARKEAESARHAASDNERKATHEAAKSRAALDFVTEMFGAVDPARAGSYDVTVAEILDPAADKVAQAFAGDSEGEAVVRSVLGEAYTNLARYADAERELERAWALQASVDHPDIEQTAAILHNLGAVVLERGDVARARDLLQQAWKQRSARLGDEHRDTLATLSLLAFAKQLAGDVNGATADIRAVLLVQERSLGPNDRNTLESMCSLADMLGSAGKPEEALAVAHDAAGRATAQYGADTDLALMAASIEAELLQTLARFDEAASLLEQVVKGKEKLYGVGHPKTLVSLDLLARSLASFDQNERAIALSRTVVARATESLGERHAATLVYMNNLAQVLRQVGQFEEAEPIYRHVIALRRDMGGDRDPETLQAMGNLGLLLMQRDDPAEAMLLFREALDGLRSALPADHWMLGVAMLNLGRCRTALGEYPAAETTLTEAHALVKKTLGATHRLTLQVRTALAALYDAWGKPEQAETWRAAP